jgi:hypothetical protein
MKDLSLLKRETQIIKFDEKRSVVFQQLTITQSTQMYEQYQNIARLVSTDPGNVGNLLKSRELLDIQDRIISLCVKVLRPNPFKQLWLTRGYIKRTMSKDQVDELVKTVFYPFFEAVDTAKKKAEGV